MIYITGDLHGGLDAKKLLKLPFINEVKEDDVLIVCGDFGYIWETRPEFYDIERKELDLLMKSIKCTMLFITGNHENFSRYSTFPVTELYGGKVQKITEKCYRVMDGEVLKINGKRFLFIGGAESFDKQYRTEGKNWWRDERVSIKAVNKAIKNSNNIDYVISHCAPLSIRNKIFLNENIPFNPNEVDESCKNLELLYAHIAGKKWKWFMGHYHLDVIYKPFYVLYNRIIKLED